MLFVFCFTMSYVIAFQATARYTVTTMIIQVAMQRIILLHSKYLVSYVQ